MNKNLRQNGNRRFRPHNKPATGSGSNRMRDTMLSLKEQLSSACPFSDALECRDEGGYPVSEICYIRAYHDGDQWCNRVFPINWQLATNALVKEADEVYAAFRKDFPNLDTVRDYVEHDAERQEDLSEGYAYLELEDGRYCLRLITRKGDYNLYLHVLSKSAVVERS